MDYTVDGFVNKMIKAIIGISVLMMIGGIAFFRSSLAVGFVLGICIALALNIVKIIWLRYCVNRAVSMEASRAGAYISLNYILRYALTGAVLAASHFLPGVDMFGAVLGLLAIPFANYVVHFINRNNKVPVPDEAGTEEAES